MHRLVVQLVVESQPGEYGEILAAPRLLHVVDLPRPVSPMELARLGEWFDGAIASITKPESSPSTSPADNSGETGESVVA